MDPKRDHNFDNHPDIETEVAKAETPEVEAILNRLRSQWPPTQTGLGFRVQGLGFTKGPCWSLEDSGFNPSTSFLQWTILK